MKVFLIWDNGEVVAEFFKQFYTYLFFGVCVCVTLTYTQRHVHAPGDQRTTSRSLVFFFLPYVKGLNSACQAWQLVP